MPRIIACGGRDDAFDRFRHAPEEQHAILLVDSEGPVATKPWVHLKARDGWDPGAATDDQAQLMVACMERGLWRIARP
jgi:hypothetical protein